LSGLPGRALSRADADLRSLFSDDASVNRTLRLAIALADNVRGKKEPA